jgi:integrase
LVGRAKQLFYYFERTNYVPRNPFRYQRAGLVANRERDYYVTPDEAARVLDTLPTTEWKALFALARFGGLRVPSEVVGLTWEHVNFEHGLLCVPTPKTAREGKNQRLVPLFPELRFYLSKLFDEAEPGSIYVFNQLRPLLVKPNGTRNVNLRTQLIRMIVRAGLKPWPKVWQNLRRACAVDLVQEYPANLAYEWLGHSEAINRLFYFRATPQMIERATQHVRLPSLFAPPQKAEANTSDSEAMAND